jgi:hypothetical protein
LAFFFISSTGCFSARAERKFKVAGKEEVLQEEQYRIFWWRIRSVIPIFPKGRQFSYVMISKFIIFVVKSVMKRFLRKKERRNEIFY